jgi:hypothetical protein
MSLLLRLALTLTATEGPDKVLVDKVLTSLPRESQGGLFFTVSAGAPILQTENRVGSRIILRSDFLYGSNGLPIDHKNIAALVLAGLALHHKVEKIENMFAWAIRVLDFVVNKRTSVSLSSVGRTDKVHFLGFSKHQELILLEQSYGTVDLSNIIPRSLGCPGAAFWKFTTYNLVKELSNAQRVVLKNQIEWICPGVTTSPAVKKGVFVFDLKFKPNGTFDLQTSSGKIFK